VEEIVDPPEFIPKFNVTVDVAAVNVHTVSQPKIVSANLHVYFVHHYFRNKIMIFIKTTCHLGPLYPSSQGIFQINQCKDVTHIVSYRINHDCDDFIGNELICLVNYSWITTSHLCTQCAYCYFPENIIYVI
jgi:hypothetical protein